MGRFLGPGQIEAWEKRTEKARREEKEREKAKLAAKRMVKDFEAIDKGKELIEENQEKE